ncbi:FkbM family methyltransferase [Aeromonas enteropelogenes]|uniref:FkbM family methyltransferase n=1 Tax=Aeromonas enteropelogenes TaxID=29489 RepID=UPI00191DA2CC|nr:FkbM family methyltransferase [Aeromonas enteropelogenes]MBL0456190.1 FkbM family methyltransferase [Aeromonas enteropelogenes]
MTLSFAELVDMLHVKNRDLLTLIEKRAVFGIFGTGKLAQDCYTQLRKMGHCASFFVDRNQDEEMFFEHPLRTIHSLAHSNVPLLIASTWASEIIRDLRAANFNGEVFVIDPFVTIFEKMTETDKQQLLIFFEQLADDESKKILQSLIAFRCGVGVVHKSNYPQYFCPDMPYISSDVVIDGGAYIGDTIKSLFYENDVSVQTVHAFEPDPENYSLLTHFCKKNNLNVITQQKGLWSSTQVLGFSNDQIISYGRKIDAIGSCSIETVSVDEYVKANDIAPTMIKLDVEGAELQALKGAEQTICSLKPKLAISLYHIHTDLWRLPALLKMMNPDYRFYLGQHRKNWLETVLYAQ